jgi:integrase
MLFCFLRLAATTGARRGQLLALRWRDVDLDRGTIAFTRALVMGPEGPVLAATKNDRTHQVELDGETLHVLHDARVRAEKQAVDAGVALAVEAFLFTRDADGHRPWPPNHATHQFIAARRAAGLPHFRLHDFRHFMATQMLASSVPLATVAQRLNHARVSTTVNIYTHAIRAWDRPAAEMLSTLLADPSVPVSDTAGG